MKTYNFFHASDILYVMNYCFYHIYIEINDCWAKIDLTYNDKTNKSSDYKQACIRISIKEVFFDYNHEDNLLKKILVTYLKSLNKQFNDLIFTEGL